jgi:HAD superfamily hydrolase (TIGR01548 family)
VATAAELRALAAAAPHALVVIDQAYVEFADDDPLPHLLDFPNVLITRTFSKAWGLPGLRIGFAIGAPEVISAMRRVAPPYAVSGPALVVADAVLAAGDGAVRSRADCLAARRARLEATLRDLGGSPVPSQANFVSDASPRAAWFRDGLAGLGIAVRWLPGTPSDRIRITTPLSPADSDRLERALRTVGDPQALLFDMDGVLADVRESYDAAIVATAASHGVRLGQVDVEAGKAAGNANDDWTLTRNLLAAQGVEVPLDEVIARFESLYRGNSSSPGLCTRETLIPPRALLERLAARLPLGIVTGRPRTDANRFLEQMDLVGMFAVVVTRDDAPLKPDAAPVRLALARLGVERAWLVGDTPDDVRAARGAGVVPIGAVPPFTPIPPLTDALLGAGAARVLTSLVDLPSWLP